MRRRWERAPASRSVGREVGSRWSPKLQQKHETRQRFHPQLKRLWDTTPFLKTGGRSRPSALLIEDSPDIPPFDVAALAAKYSLYGWNFVPFVTEELNLICGLDILFLRPSAPGQLVSGGDLDNRLKTLFDALRIPEASERYADRVPDDPDEKPARCLCHDGLFAHLTHSLRRCRRVMKHDARFIGIGAAGIQHLEFGSFRALGHFLRSGPTSRSLFTMLSCCSSPASKKPI